jgi:hypothetical protein
MSKSVSCSQISAGNQNQRTDFEFDLPQGTAELRTALYDAVMNGRGPYYVNVERP